MSNTQSDTALREQVHAAFQEFAEIIVFSIRNPNIAGDMNDPVEAVLALFSQEKHKLLQELLEEATEYDTGTTQKPWSVRAVPVEVIQQYITKGDK